MVPFRPMAPNAFSPNGDGINDLFFLTTRRAIPIKEWPIFDRWGNIVWQARAITTNDPMSGWNGKIQQQNAPPGLYIWRAVIMRPQADNQTLSGEITLIR